MMLLILVAAMKERPFCSPKCRGTSRFPLFLVFFFPIFSLFLNFPQHDSHRSLGDADANSIVFPAQDGGCRVRRRLRNTRENERMYFSITVRLSVLYKAWRAKLNYKLNRLQKVFFFMLNKPKILKNGGTTQQN